MVATIALIVDWYWPYPTIKDAKAAACEFDESLYLAIGKTVWQREAHLQYVSISNKSSGSISDNHYKLPTITKGLQIWLGEIGSQSIAGRKSANQSALHSNPILKQNGNGAVTGSGRTSLNSIRRTNSRGCNGSVRQGRANAYRTMT